MTVDHLLTFYVIALGLVVGSYLNVVIHRLPRGTSTVLPRSACPFCGSLIAPRDNLPLISFLWLRGRCRRCRSRISWRYPLVEAAASALFVSCFLLFGPPANRFFSDGSWVLAAGFGCLLLALTAIDVEHLLLPDRLTLPGIAAGILLQPWLPWGKGFLAGLLGAVVGAAVLLAVYGSWYLLRRTEGLGLGDVKMLALIGAFLGWQGALEALMTGTVLAAAVALASMAFGRLGLQHKMAFGPFLAAGAVWVMLATGAGLEIWPRLLGQ